MSTRRLLSELMADITPLLKPYADLGMNFTLTIHAACERGEDDICLVAHTCVGKKIASAAVRTETSSHLM